MLRSVEEVNKSVRVVRVERSPLNRHAHQVGELSDAIFSDSGVHIILRTA
jgi:hypothetical protein